MIGAHTGDGSLYRTNRAIVWEIRGALNEKDYYIKNICPLLKKIFNFEIKSKFRNDGCKGVWGVQTSKKEIVDLFLYFGFKPGTKTYTVSVPNYIFNSNIEIKRAFVRGLFDTDGCLRFDRINKNKFHTYPRIEFSFASLNLRNSLKILLDELKFNPFVWDEKSSYSLCLAGKYKLERWVKEIKPKNPKHLNKYLNWKRKGIYKA